MTWINLFFLKLSVATWVWAYAHLPETRVCVLQWPESACPVHAGTWTGPEEGHGANTDEQGPSGFAGASLRALLRSRPPLNQEQLLNSSTAHKHPVCSTPVHHSTSTTKHSGCCRVDYFSANDCSCTSNWIAKWLHTTGWCLALAREPGTCYMRWQPLLQTWSDRERVHGKVQWHVHGLNECRKSK